MIALGAVFLAVSVPMAVEALIASRHDAILFARGAVEPPDDVLGQMRFAYPGVFAGMLAEGWLRDASFDGVFLAGAVIFAAAKALKWWAMATLGERWTFRVLVPPDSVRTISGPYVWVRHPNYVGVIGEIVGAALMCRAFITGPVATLLFLDLIRRRIIVEERALGIKNGA